jgi:hypothetical protein
MLIALEGRGDIRVWADLGKDVQQHEIKKYFALTSNPCFP